MSEYFKAQDIHKYGSEKAANNNRIHSMKQNLATSSQPKNVSELIDKLWNKDSEVDKN